MRNKNTFSLQIFLFAVLFLNACSATPQIDPSNGSIRDLDQETADLAAQLAQGATLALGAAKRLLHDGWTGTLETQMELETRAIADAGRTYDARDGIAAFIEKRDPIFEGR